MACCADRTLGPVGEAERADASGAVLAEVTTAAMSVRSSSAAHQLRALEPEGVLDHIGPGADIIVPLANGEPVTLLDALEAAADELDGVRVHQMHALHDRPYLHGAFGDRLRHVSYFLSHVTRPVLPRRHDRPGAEQLQRDARPAPRHDRRPAGPRRRLAPGPPRVLQPRAQRRLRRRPSSAGPASSSRPTPRCRARSAATSSTSARCVGLESRPTGRSSRCRPAAPSDRRRTHRRARRRADPRRGDDPGRHRLDPQRDPRAR